MSAAGEWDVDSDDLPEPPVTNLSEDEARGYFNYTSSAENSSAEDEHMSLQDHKPTALQIRRQTFRASAWIEQYGGADIPVTPTKQMEEIRHEVSHPAARPIPRAMSKSSMSTLDDRDLDFNPITGRYSIESATRLEAFQKPQIPQPKVAPLPKPTRQAHGSRSPGRTSTTHRPASQRKGSSRPNSGPTSDDPLVPLPATMNFPSTPTRSSIKSPRSPPIKAQKDSDLPALPRESLPAPPPNLKALRNSAESRTSRSRSRPASRDTKQESVSHSRVTLPPPVIIQRPIPEKASHHSLVCKTSNSSLQQYYSPFGETPSRFSDEKSRVGSLPLPVSTTRPASHKSRKPIAKAEASWWTRKKIIWAIVVLLLVAIGGAVGAVLALVVFK